MRLRRGLATASLALAFLLSACGYGSESQESHPAPTAAAQQADAPKLTDVCKAVKPDAVQTLLSVGLWSQSVTSSAGDAAGCLYWSNNNMMVATLWVYPESNAHAPTFVSLRKETATNGVDKEVDAGCEKYFSPVSDCFYINAHPGKNGALVLNRSRTTFQIYMPQFDRSAVNRLGSITLANVS